MFLQIVAVIGLFSIANAGIVGVADGHGHVVDLHTPAHYEFKYGVVDPKTGDKKEQSEVRSGDVVKGQYSVAEPDGTVRVVTYTADDHNGFNAVVKRIGHAAHPQVLIKKAVVPVATHSIAVAPVASHGIAVAAPVATHGYAVAAPVATHGIAISHGVGIGGIGLGAIGGYGLGGGLDHIGGDRLGNLGGEVGLGGHGLY